MLFFSTVHVTDNNLLALVMFDGGVNGPMFVTCHVLVKEIGWAVPWATHFAVANLVEGAENWGMTSRNGKWKSCFLSQQGTRLDFLPSPLPSAITSE